jgi:hypothetical protein
VILRFKQRKPHAGVPEDSAEDWRRGSRASELRPQR